jgi:hypothetical protein
MNTLPPASLAPISHSACHDPTSLQPIAAGTTAARRVRSITAVSIAPAGTEVNSGGRRAKSRSGLIAAMQARQAASIAGSSRSSSSRNTLAENRNMPLFQA